MTGGIYDVDSVVFPKAGGGGGSDGDALTLCEYRYTDAHLSNGDAGLYKESFPDGWREAIYLFFARASCIT